MDGIVRVEARVCERSELVEVSEVDVFFGVLPEENTREEPEFALFLLPCCVPGESQTVDQSRDQAQHMRRELTRLLASAHVELWQHRERLFALVIRQLRTHREICAAVECVQQEFAARTSLWLVAQLSRSDGVANDRTDGLGDRTDGVDDHTDGVTDGDCTADHTADQDRLQRQHKRLPACLRCMALLDLEQFSPVANAAGDWADVAPAFGCALCHSLHSDACDSEDSQLNELRCQDCQQQSAHSRDHEQFDQWHCLLCHRVGCGRRDARHAMTHFSESGHRFALNARDLAVWDYVNDMYVERGNPRLESPVPHATPRQPQHYKDDDEDAYARAKAASVRSYYEGVLHHQLRQQTEFWEAKLRRFREISDLQHGLAERRAEEESLNSKIVRQERVLQQTREEHSFAREINESLSQQRHLWTRSDYYEEDADYCDAPADLQKQLRQQQRAIQELEQRRDRLMRRLNFS